MKINKDFASLIPPLSPEEYSGLESSLLSDGCRDSLVTWRGVLIDGHNRYRICDKHGIKFTTVEKEFETESDARVWIIRNQLSRRNITLGARCLLAIELEKALKPKAKANERARKGGQRGADKFDKIVKVKSQESAAKSAGVSNGTLSAFKKIQEHGTKEEKHSVLVNPNVKLHKVASDVRRRILKADHAKKTKAAKKHPKPKGGPYDLVLADPPWRYEHCESPNREIENQYPTATLEEIFAHRPETKPDSILFLWATAPKLKEAMMVMEKWGFDYRSCAVWDKGHMGMGYWWRIQHELLLVGVRGKPGVTPESQRISSVFLEMRKRHSAKPKCVMEWIEKSFPEHSKLEMYCRTPRKGWDTHGNE